MPHLGARDTDGWAVAGSAHVDENRRNVWQRKKLLWETQTERRWALLRRWLRRVLTFRTLAELIRRSCCVAAGDGRIGAEFLFGID